MARSALILLLVIVISLAVFKAIDRNAGAQDVSELNQVLENQKLILEKLDFMDHKLDVLKTRLY